MKLNKNSSQLARNFYFIERLHFLLKKSLNFLAVRSRLILGEAGHYPKIIVLFVLVYHFLPPYLPHILVLYWHPDTYQGRLHLVERRLYSDSAIVFRLQICCQQNLLPPRCRTNPFVWRFIKNQTF